MNYTFAIKNKTVEMKGSVGTRYEKKDQERNRSASKNIKLEYG